MSLVTREELIAELQSLQSENSRGTISRDTYLAKSTFNKGAYVHHFGTFSEFKRQAGIADGLGVVRLSNNIARHVANDRFDAVNAAKSQYEGKYDRPSNKRFKTYVVATDVHDVDCDPFWKRVFLDTIARAQPDGVIFGGDLFDLPEFGRYNIDPREWDVVGRIKWVHDFLGEVRNAVPDATLTLIEGNHEARLLKHLADSSPAMQVLLSDLHKFDVSSLLGLDKFEMNYIARTDLGAFNQRDLSREVARNYLILDDAFIVHHFPEGRHMGYPGLNGHHHKQLVYPSFSPRFGSYTWQQIGCGHKRAASYCDGEKWANGFALVHIDTETKRSVIEYVDLTQDHAVVGGKWYTRDSSESGM